MVENKNRQWIYTLDCIAWWIYPLTCRNIHPMKTDRWIYPHVDGMFWNIGGNFHWRVSTVECSVVSQWKLPPTIMHPVAYSIYLRKFLEGQWLFPPISGEEIVEVENSGNNSLSGEKTTPSRKVLCWKLGGGSPPPKFWESCTTATCTTALEKEVDSLICIYLWFVEPTPLPPHFCKLWEHKLWSTNNFRALGIKSAPTFQKLVHFWWWLLVAESAGTKEKISTAKWRRNTAGSGTYIINNHSLTLFTL